MLRLMLSVKVGGQLARLDRMGDPRGEWLLEPLRGALGRVGQCGHGRCLRQSVFSAPTCSPCTSSSNSRPPRRKTPADPPGP